MRLGKLKDFIERMEKKYGPMILDLPVSLMQETTNLQLESELKDHAVCTGKDGPNEIILIGNEEDS